MNDPFTRSYKISGDAICQQIGDEMVILDLSGEQYFGLDEVGVRVWQLLDGGADLAGVFDVLLQEYEVTPETLRADLAALALNLVEAGLLVTEAP